MEDIEKIYEKLSQIEQNFGIWMVLLVLAFGLAMFFYWKYLIKTVELKAQKGFEKELTKFKTKHGKQVDAIHECYSRFERLTSFINYMMNGEKYIAPMDIEEQMQVFLKFRKEFKDTFNEHRLVFSVKTCGKIDALFPIIDKYFEAFTGGNTIIRRK